MNVRVEPNRFLSVACDPDERIVFDRKETRYHLLRDSAARLWDEICEGGTFEVAAPTEGEDPIAMLAEAGLLGFDEGVAEEGITRRVWLRRTGKVSAAAVVLPLVATLTTPTLSLGQNGVASLDEVTGDQIGEQITEVEQTLTKRELRDRRRELRREGKNKDEESETTTRIRRRDRQQETETTEPTSTTRTRTRTRTGGENESSSSTSDLFSRLGRGND